MTTVENESGLRPLGHAVLVEYYEPERKASVIVLSPGARERENALEQRARVIEVGPAAWPDEPPRAVSGDYVLISRMAGAQVTGPKDGKAYRMVNDRDIFAQITHLEAA
jgi:co-chaperonin GroES (HSP10)